MSNCHGPVSTNLLSVWIQALRFLALHVHWYEVMEPKQIITKLAEIGVCYADESSPELDEDGCFELALGSSECGPGDAGCCDQRDCCPVGEGTPDNYNDIASAVGVLGCEIVDFGEAGWEGYSCYTPCPGGVRRIKVRQIGTQS